MNIPNAGKTRAQQDIPTSAGAQRPRRFGSRLWVALIVVILAIILIPTLLSEMITDWMWFGSQGFADVYTTRLWLSLGVFAGGLVVSGLFLGVNWLVAARALEPTTVYPGQAAPLPRGLVRWLVIIAAAVLALIMGLIASGEWPTILLYLNGGAFGQTDPIFNNDIGFYVFGLPFFEFLRGWFLGLLILTAIGVGIIYFLSIAPQLGNIGDVQVSSRGMSSRPSLNISLDKRAGVHLSVLGAIFLAIVAVGYWLSRFDLLYSDHAVAYGASYTDVNAKLPSLYILMAVAGLMAILLLVNVWVRTWRLLLGAVGLWLLALILVGGIYPYVVQQFIVRPSELEKEQPYIVNNIAATRQAFGLDKFQDKEVPAVDSVTPQQISTNQSTVNNIRLWDYRPLLDTYSVLQELRPYYSFGQVDIDRYNINGAERQVMLSARELNLNSNQVSDQIRNWQNQRLVYTHGYGAVASPVNEIAGEGLPNLWLKDFPPQTSYPALKITQPDIYYGEQTGDYVFVNTGVKEFDYPQSGASGEANVTTTYSGTGGVPVGDFLSRLLFSVRFGDGNVMLSNYITPNTRILFHRTVDDAMEQLAPFLSYDHDPYLVIADGKLYWIRDAYTTSDRYPYSTPAAGGENYIRNSVKVVMDAYNGNVTYYVANPTDPIIQAYRGIFPVLFKDISQMPAGIRAHVRYPEDIMDVQAQMYATYHVTDPNVFYTKEDVWTVPTGSQDQNALPLESYYVNMALPGESKEEFMLILPFTPNGRDNMIAWMAAKSDGADYGTVNVIRYPKQQLVYGPSQISARINQNPTISQQLTLWNQSGSTVIHGNLLIIPIANSVLYVEPLFLQATNQSSNSNFPELKRVIVATGNNVGIGSDLNDALDVAFNLEPGQVIGAGTGTGTSGGTGPNPTPGANGTPGTTGTPATRSPADLTQSARSHYDRAQVALKQSDWTTYGNEINAMKADLDALATQLGVPTEVPTPGTQVAPTPGGTQSTTPGP